MPSLGVFSITAKDSDARAEVRSTVYVPHPSSTFFSLERFSLVHKQVVSNHLYDAGKRPQSASMEPTCADSPTRFADSSAR